MSEDWDFYFARVNDAVSSIYLDLGLKNFAPNEKRPWLLWVWIEMHSPRDDGLSSSAEAPKLYEIEESLKAMIAPACGAQFVGRITGSNRREFYFYGEEPGELDAAIQRALTRFADYGFEAGSKLDPDWEQYLELLYPSPTNLQRMLNRRVLEALAEKGDVHEMPRQVDHWLQFADEASRDACRETLLAIDFKLEGEYLSDDPAADQPWSLVVSRVDSVDSHTINGITLELMRLAEERGGGYDGWECPVTEAEASE